MSKKKFSALLGSVILVIVAVALLVPERTGRDDMPDQDLLLPGLAERINDVELITVTTGADGLVATLERRDTVWAVREHAFIGAAVNGHATVAILKTISDVKNVTGINLTPNNVIYVAATRQ